MAPDAGRRIPARNRSAVEPTALVYLLHADPAPLHPQHYLGRTTPTGFRARMRRHCLGTGSLQTRRWATDHAKVIRLAMLIAGPPALETALLHFGRFADWCPICCGRTPGRQLHAVAGLEDRRPPDWRPLE